MLKFVKHNLETIADVEIYPIISLSIFFTVFIAYGIYAFTCKKETINELSNLPFND
jgi:hypothetical protein